MSARVIEIWCTIEFAKELKQYIFSNASSHQQTWSDRRGSLERLQNIQHVWLQQQIAVDQQVYSQPTLLACRARWSAVSCGSSCFNFISRPSTAWTNACHGAVQVLCIRLYAEKISHLLPWPASPSGRHTQAGSTCAQETSIVIKILAVLSGTAGQHCAEAHLNHLISQMSET